MATLAEWAAATRPRTLPAAFAPVAIGTGAAHAAGASDAGLALLALVVAVALQIGVNFANDYSDGVRGTDATRVGPTRLVGQGLADAASVRAAAFGCFGVAAVTGLALVALTNSWLMLLFGGLAIVAAWRYTGGAHPYGYRGLGEVAVFTFFGLVAVLGTQWTQAHVLSLAGLAGAVGTGAFACGILVANNLRDIPGDQAVGKRTLAVRIGPEQTRSLYVALIALPHVMVPLVAIGHPWALLALLALPVSWPFVRLVRSGATGAALIPVLGGTGAAQLTYAVLLSLGLLLPG